MYLDFQTVATCFRGTFNGSHVKEIVVEIKKLAKGRFWVMWLYAFMPKFGSYVGGCFYYSTNLNNIGTNRLGVESVCR